MTMLRRLSSFFQGTKPRGTEHDHPLSSLPTIERTSEPDEVEKETDSQEQDQQPGFDHLFAQATGLIDRPTEPKRLHRQYGRMYSQFAEDGYIAEIFDRIGASTRTFLEIGVEDGTENTTRLLLESGWSGVWVEGSPSMAASASRTFSDYIDAGRLKVLPTMAEPGSINEILDRGGVAYHFDLITVDVDQHTSHIWRALNRNSLVACIEYNASLPPSLALEVPYQQGSSWDGTNFFGASLKTMELIGSAKGMALVGCDLSGVNSYFVASEKALPDFCAPFTAENHYEPPRYRLSAQMGHPPSKRARHWSTPIEQRT